MSGGHPESGDHQSIFSVPYFRASAANSNLFQQFTPIDAGDTAQFGSNDGGAYLSNDDRTYYNSSTLFDYQEIQTPEGNQQYLRELETDKWFLVSMMQIFSTPCFFHASKLIDDEISRVHSALGRDLVVSVLYDDRISFSDELPMPEGEVVTVEEKVMVPVDTNPEYNFIGRLMGPRGMTIKRLEQETGCRLLVRGRGSTKDAAKENALRRKPGFEHLNENLHILVQAKDAENRVQSKLNSGVGAVKQMLTPVTNDELKKRQMRELAIINGTYRPVQRSHQMTSPVESSVFFDQVQNQF